jgi:hypothetical protein
MQTAVGKNERVDLTPKQRKSVASGIEKRCDSLLGV